MSLRKVVESDFRQPEYKDAKVEDYEFRADGALVRKDRWEKGIYSICGLVGLSTREFEIPEVVDAVRKLVEADEGWIVLEDEECYPQEAAGATVRLQDGSTLRNVTFTAADKTWRWNGFEVPSPVIQWRKEEE